MKKPYRRAFIEITNGCNLACAFCARSARAKKLMPLRLFEAAAAQAGALAETISPHLLGEPLTHPDFPAMLAACSRSDLKVNLVTNGLLLRRFPPELFREKCLRQISVSLHALSCLPSAERGAALNRLAAFARDKPEAVTIGFRLRGDTQGSFFRETLEGLLKAFSVNAATGAAYVKLGEGIFLNFGEIFSWPGANGAAAKRGCLGLRHHFGILSDGRVVPCCADFDGALALGSIKERPLAEILSSPEALALGSSIAGRTPMPGFCSSCGFSPSDS
jgi:MoaA/NifB/PqqE/SkfB family radical SAM enzyme